jgi:hypothetical protein
MRIYRQKSGSRRAPIESAGPALFGRRGFVTQSIGYDHSIIQKIPPLLGKIKKLPQRWLR